MVKYKKYIAQQKVSRLFVFTFWLIDASASIKNLIKTDTLNKNI